MSIFAPTMYKSTPSTNLGGSGARVLPRWTLISFRFGQHSLYHCQPSCHYNSHGTMSPYKAGFRAVARTRTQKKPVTMSAAFIGARVRKMRYYWDLSSLPTVHVDQSSSLPSALAYPGPAARVFFATSLTIFLLAASSWS